MPNSFPFYDAEPYWPAGGYGNGGGGNGGSGGSTASLTDLLLWNNMSDHPTEVPTKVSYVSGFSNDLPVLTDLRFDAVTRVEDGTTKYGVHVYDCPVGAILHVDCTNIDGSCILGLCYLPDGKSDPINDSIKLMSNVCPMPIDGYTISGIYYNALDS